MQNYNYNKIKSRDSYSVAEISILLGISKKTCGRWIKNEGLEVILKDAYPRLIMGNVLKKFIKDKRAKRKMPTKENEFICFKCHKVVKAETGSEQIIKTGKRIGKDNHEQLRKTGLCEHCGTEVGKYV